MNAITLSSASPLLGGRWLADLNQPKEHSRLNLAFKATVPGNLVTAHARPTQRPVV